MKAYRNPCLSLLVVLAAACAAPEPGEDPATGVAESALYTATLSASPEEVELGQTVTVSWTAGAEHSIYDRIGLYITSGADNSPYATQYVGAAGETSGTLTFTVPLSGALNPGPYNFRYLAGSTKLATSNSVTGFADYSLTDPPASVELGQAVSVTWHAPLAHSAYDAVGLFKTTASNTQPYAGQSVGNAGQTSGTLTFTLSLSQSLDPGPFEFRYLYGSIARATSAPFTAYANYSITDTTLSVELGQTVTGTWHAPLAHSAYDTVRLYKVGAADNAIIASQYVGNAGQPSGTVTLTVPLTPARDPGPYELRYYYGTRRATSDGFSGYANYTLSSGLCRTGLPFAVDWTAPLAHSAGDRIGLYTAGGSSLGSQSVLGAGSPSGSLTLTGPAPGAYELRYLFGGVVTATEPLTCSN